MELDSLSLWPIYAIIGSVLAVACPLGLALAILCCRGAAALRAANAAKRKRIALLSYTYVYHVH